MRKVLLEIDGKIARITLNRPKVLNAIDHEVPALLSQAVIEADNNSACVMNNFGDTEIIEYQEIDGSRITLRLVAETPQYLSVHHFEDSNGNFQDINPHVDSSPSGLTPITNLDRLEKRNEELKQIIVLKPDAIVKVVGEFNKFMKE